MLQPPIVLAEVPLCHAHQLAVALWTLFDPNVVPGLWSLLPFSLCCLECPSMNVEVPKLNTPKPGCAMAWW